MSELARIPDIEKANARAATNSALDLLNQALIYIDDARKRCVELGDNEGLMLGLENVTLFKKQLDVLVQSVKMDLLTSVASWMPVPGGTGYVGTDPSHTDTWDSEALMARIVQGAFDGYLSAHDGEIESIVELVATVVGNVWACAPLTPSTSWRVTALKDRGIDPEDYRQRTTKTSIKWAETPPAPIRARVVRKKG